MSTPVVHRDIKRTPEGEKILAEATSKIIGSNHSDFDQYLKEASETVASWPEWKRKALGWAYVSKEDDN